MLKLIIKPTRLLLTLGALSLVFLTGCTSLPKKEMDASDQQRIKTVALLHVLEPKKDEVVNIGGAAGAFGLIGAMVQVSVNEHHTTIYTKDVQDAKIEFAPILRDAVMKTLTADGYHPVYLQDQQAKLAADGKSDDFSDIKTDADAIMQVWFSDVGYVSPPELPDFIPTVIIHAEILDSKTKQDMYNKTYACGWDIKHNSVHVVTDPAYTYSSFDKLTQSFDQSVTGLKTCESDVVALVGKDLHAAK